MGDHDDAGINDPVTKVEDIDVDNPRGVWLGTGSATEVILDGLSILEESRRLAHVIDFNYGIEEVGCILGAVNGLALVDGSLFEVGAVRGEGAEEISGGSQIGKSGAQIGAQCYSHARGHLRAFTVQNAGRFVKSGRGSGATG